MKKVIIILGPTATGKSSLSIKLAEYLNTEIISGDSVQVYRSLNIGSAKLSNQEMNGIKHHLIDIKEPSENYSVSDFQKDARKLIIDLNNKNLIPIVCGGTGFYIKSLIYNYEFLATSRTDEYNNLSNDELYNELSKLNDPNIPDIHNRKRLLRHLEILSSNSMSNKKDELLFDPLIIGLSLDRTILYERINERVDKMIENGLIDEVKKLYDDDVRSYSMLSIGYKELYEYFDNKVTLDEAIENIKKHTRNFAKRQITYYKNQFDNICWFNALDENLFDKVLEEVEKYKRR